MNTNKQLGFQGEAFVREALIKRGYEIIETNFASRYGEIDIIAREGGEICFVEVKTRLNASYGDPFEAITPFKQKQLIKMAKYYMLEHECDEVNARFDVAAVLGNPDGQAQLEIIKNAFELGPYQ